MARKFFYISAGLLCLGIVSPAKSPGSPALELNSGSIPPGGVYAHTFTSAGRFPYHCVIHPFETGSVTVSVAVANDSAVVAIVGPSQPGYNPEAVTIKPGGSVRWANVSAFTHTVTSDSPTRSRNTSWGGLKARYQ